MGLIKEPLEVDFVVESRPLTKQEEQIISEFIKADKNRKRSFISDKTPQPAHIKSSFKRKYEFV